ncbi:nitronate monooxygenase [Comamonas sp. JC664]|uniref:NAD(P)H-dependent flavin oxidoreductase n=1 Tax=Comamonas sp. JC664 TaxID=2801917 RepID=UPI00174BA6C8|nr:nitronate monooxygenase [Comamonas sp. JC664]MBL0695216.1 nitronate monooxygenase [Comamonas sp. JC664]GHG86786.1 2-nitropropane dioxygenase [Comamonas sp. KCTC 72670]
MNGANDGRSPPSSRDVEPDEERGDAGPEEPRRPAIYVLEGNTLQTRLTRELGVNYPFVSDGMAFVSLPPLVLAVSEAGGVGMLGVVPEPPDVLDVRIQTVQAGTQKPFGANLLIAPDGGQHRVTREHVDVCIARRVPIVSFQGDLPPADWVTALKGAGIRVWLQAPSLELARQALALGADGLIAQGRQASGINHSGLPTLALVRALRAMTDTVPVLASGGIADGLSAARALFHGADGVWVSTRMVASVEAYAHPDYKQRIVEGDAGDSDFTTVFGADWPGQRMRVLRNRVVREWTGREGRVPMPVPAPERVGSTRLFPGTPGGTSVDIPRFSAFVPTPDTQGDLDEMAMPASGASMARIESIQPAGQIVVELMERARRVLADPHGLEADAEEDDRG